MSGFSKDQLELLNQSLNVEHIKQRTEGKMVLNYIDGYHAIAEANRIFGFDGWSYELISCDQTMQRSFKNHENKDRVEVAYCAKIRVYAGGVHREGLGFGSSVATPNNLSRAIEGSYKEAETDALKRALRSFGNQFGLALYDKSDKPNITDEEQFTTRQLDEIFMKVCDAFKISKSSDDLLKAFNANKNNIKILQNNSQELFNKMVEVKDVEKERLKSEEEKLQDSQEAEVPPVQAISKLFIDAKTAEELERLAVENEHITDNFGRDDKETIKKQYQFCLNKLQGVENE